MGQVRVPKPSSQASATQNLTIHWLCLKNRQLEPWLDGFATSSTSDSPFVLSLSKDMTATSVSVEPDHCIGTVSSNRFLIASSVHTSNHCPPEQHLSKFLNFLHAILKGEATRLKFTNHNPPVVLYDESKSRGHKRETSIIWNDWV